MIGASFIGLIILITLYFLALFNGNREMSLDIGMAILLTGNIIIIAAFLFNLLLSIWVKDLQKEKKKGGKNRE